jgi:cation diffusion facilitator CzcD-associated flavoprotein CzcO
MTTVDAGLAAPASVSELRDRLRHADPAVLVTCLVQLTGDAALLDRYDPLLTPVPVRSVLESHTVDPAAADEIVERMVAEMTARVGATLPPPKSEEPEHFRRMAEFCVGEPVDAEFVPILEEQAGFVSARRVVPVTRTPPSDWNVIVIGAGMTGINAAIKLGEAGFRYHVFESRHELGGTWSINKYPGAAVDTPSAYYSYSFEPNPAWTHFYPVGDEYHDYLKRVAEKYDVAANISFDTAVTGCRWSDDRQRWVVTTSHNGDTTEHEAAAVVTALGFLNRPNIPDIPGRDGFEGAVVHSARWDPSIDLVGKRVVLLGAGCTAVQIAEAVAGDAAALTVVQQQPHWIRPMKATHGRIPDALRWVICNVPHYQRWFRLKTYWYASDNIYPIPRIDPEWYASHVSASPANDALMQVCLAYIEASFPDRPDLREKLTPDFPPFAKRIIGDPGYYKALALPTVELVTGTIERYESDGVIVTGGRRIACDVVVLATGFTLDFLRTIDVTGRDGMKLADTWGDDPRAYLGMQVPGFPNLFTTAGPNSASNHGGGHNLTAEEQVHYVVECLQYLLEHDATAMEPTQDATDTYNRRVDEELDKTVWQHGGTAHGYYRNTKGRAGIACPWRMVDYWTMLRAPHPDDLVITPAPVPAST